MNIPRPRLKAMQELDAEEKIAEKAVVTIRKKSLQVDTDLDKIREDVETEIERLDQQRSYLETGMQQLLEEQDVVMHALDELEQRQSNHKRSIAMLKEEEEEIERERRDINMAMKELRQAQASLREAVSKKYFQGPTEGFRPIRTSYAMSWRDQEKAYSGFDRQPPRWASNSRVQETQDEPRIKILRTTSQNAPQPVASKELTQESATSVETAPLVENSLASAQPAKAHKPSILKRVRLAADKYLPEPLRINKPQVAILEEKVEEAESAQALETSEEDVKLTAPQLQIEAEGAKSMPGVYVRDSEVENEISKFEDKLSEIDESEPVEKAAVPVKEEDDFKSRISNIVRSKSPSSSTQPLKPPAMEKPKASPVEKESVVADVPKEAKPKAGTLQESSETNFAKANMMSIQHPPVNPEHPHHTSDASSHPSDSLRSMAQQLQDQNMHAISTEEKLARLHSKLQEMKAALKTISKAEPKKAVQSKRSGDSSTEIKQKAIAFHKPAAKMELQSRSGRFSPPSKHTSNSEQFRKIPEAKKEAFVRKALAAHAASLKKGRRR